MPVLIHFFGADGVGKTTQANMLAFWLREKGIDTKLVRIRSGRTLASLIYRLLVTIDPALVERGEDGRVIRLNMIRGPPHQQIWSLIEFLSMIPWILFGIYIPIALGRTVIAERYVIDAIASISYLVNEPVWSKVFLSNTLLRLIPRNSIFIHLDASYHAIVKRRNAHTDPRGYIEFQRKTYSTFAKLMCATTIDTSNLSASETHRKIRQSLNICAL